MQKKKNTHRKKKTQPGCSSLFQPCNQHCPFQGCWVEFLCLCLCECQPEPRLPGLICKLECNYLFSHPSQRVSEFFFFKYKNRSLDGVFCREEKACFKQCSGMHFHMELLKWKMNVIMKPSEHMRKHM